jgi:L-asparagine transporter-like permease
MFPLIRQKKMIENRSQKALMVANLVLFVVVLMFLAFGMLTSTLGLFTLMLWIAIFLATLVSFTLHVTQGSDEWYEYSALIITGILVAMVIGLILGYDIYGTGLLMPFAVMAVFIINWMFIDRSEDAINADLEKLQKEIKQ